MKIFKEPEYQDYLLKAGIITMVSASLLSITGNEWLSILGSVLIGVFLTLFIWRNQLRSERLSKYSMIKKALLSLIVTVPVSMWGWVAKLI